MKRKKTPKDVETDVLISSRRICCLCFGLNGDYSIKSGQIAHLDQNSANNNFENLAWLCLEHHSHYDSITKQHKNYTIKETKVYRDLLYSKNTNKLPTVSSVREIDVTKPGYILLNGTTQYLALESNELRTLKDFQLELHFKLSNGKYPGVLLSFCDTKPSIEYDVIYYPSTDEKDAELQLRKIDNIRKSTTILVGVAIENIGAHCLTLTPSPDKLSFNCDGNKGYIAQPFKGFALNKITIGGKKKETYSSYVASSISYFKIFDLENNKLIKELNFQYGQKEFHNESQAGLLKVQGFYTVGSPTWALPPRSA